MLSDYRRCPACFYVKHVLRLESPPSPTMTVGGAVHAALHRFYSRWRSADAGAGPRPGLPELLVLGRRAFLDVSLKNRPIDQGALDQALALLRLAHDRFHDDRANILELEPRIVFPYTCAGAEHAFTAKPDRIDQLPDGRFRIIDYKTGPGGKAQREPAADDLQLGVYRMALAAHFGRDDLEGTAEYWLIQSGERGEIALEAIDAAAVREAIDEAAAGILAGKFDRAERTCSGDCAILGV
jgi:RecB family exonuclease